MTTTAHCPKCGRALPWVEADDYSNPADLARECATQAEYFALKPCVYVPCDSVACRAKQQPQTLEEYGAALDHWRSHQYLGGCSHGR